MRMSFSAESGRDRINELDDASNQADSDSDKSTSGLAASLRSADKNDAAGKHSKVCANLIRKKVSPEAALKCLIALQNGNYSEVAKFAGRHGPVDQAGLADYLEYCGLDEDNDVARMLKDAQRSTADRVADIEAEGEQSLKDSIGGID